MNTDKSILSSNDDDVEDLWLVDNVIVNPHWARAVTTLKADSEMPLLILSWYGE